MKSPDKSRCSDVLEHYQISNLPKFNSIKPILDTDVCCMSLESYQCNNCEFSTLFRIELLKHKVNCKIITVRVDQYDKYIQKNGIVMLKEDWEQAEKFYCTHCHYSSTVKRHLKNHIFSKHMKRLKCSQCPYRTDRKLSLSQHQTNHHGIQDANVKWFKCKSCNFQTLYKGNLISHFNKRHIIKGNIEVFRCDHCEYRTKYKKILDKHAEHAHRKCAFTTTSQHHWTAHEESGHKPEQEQIIWLHCEHCEYRTKMASQLKIHFNMKHAVGDQIKWFQCDQCDFKAKEQSVMMLYHKLKNHASDDVQMLQCEMCPFKTLYMYKLDEHLRYKHTPDDQLPWFTCDQCDFRTKLKHSLATHDARKHKK